jgi:hypothetical protein
MWRRSVGIAVRCHNGGVEDGQEIPPVFAGRGHVFMVVVAILFEQEALRPIIVAGDVAEPMHPTVHENDNLDPRFG